MDTDTLEKWLDKWTNWYEYHDDDYRNRDINTFKISLHIPYLWRNTLPNWHIHHLYTLILELRFKNCRNTMYPDDEAREVSMTENLVHPVCAYEDCKMKIKTEEFGDYDFEMAGLISTERLIHPVILSQYLQQEIIQMEKELTSLTMQRLNDSITNLNMINI